MHRGVGSCAREGRTFPPRRAVVFSIFHNGLNVSATLKGIVEPSPCYCLHPRSHRELLVNLAQIYRVFWGTVPKKLRTFSIRKKSYYTAKETYIWNKRSIETCSTTQYLHLTPARDQRCRQWFWPAVPAAWEPSNFSKEQESFVFNWRWSRPLGDYESELDRSTRPHPLSSFRVYCRFSAWLKIS